MTAKRFTNIEHDYENAWIKCNDNGDFMIYAIYKELDESLPSLEDLLNGLSEENEQLKNKIDVLEDDNVTYHKSLEKLNLYTKRFIPTKCTNEFKDCKTNRYYWLDHEGNFKGCLELLNLLDCENEIGLFPLIGRKTFRPVFHWNNLPNVIGLPYEKVYRETQKKAS